MRTVLSNFILISLMLLTSICRAELVIEIVKGSDTALPIAVVPFSYTGEPTAGDPVSRIVANDLQRSGDFETLSTSKMFSLPDSYDKVHFKDWTMLGQSYVLVGQVNFDGTNYRIQYELLDAVTQQRMAGEVLNTTKNGYRKVAHYISDVVYEKLLGVKGIFSTKIAYITVKQLTANKREYRLKVADADGYGAYTLFKSSEPILSPAWSNSGDKLAYSSFHSGRPAIYVQNIKTGKQRKVTSFKGLNDSPMWSPDDSSLLLTLSKDGNAEVYNLNLRSNDLNRLTNHYRIDTEASWSPDGKNIVFTSDRGSGTQVYMMSLADKIPQRLTFEGKYNARPRYSADGRSIFFVHKSSAADGGGFHIAALDLENDEIQVLTSTSLDESPSLSANGRMIIYSTLKGNKKALAVVSIDGGSKYFLPSPKGDVLEPAWSPFYD